LRLLNQAQERHDYPQWQAHDPRKPRASRYFRLLQCHLNRRLNGRLNRRRFSVIDEICFSLIGVFVFYFCLLGLCRLSAEGPFSFIAAFVLLVVAVSPDRKYFREPYAYSIRISGGLMFYCAKLLTRV